MVDYSKGQIYKIWDKTFTKCYVGSSVQPLCKRFQKHKSDYENFLNNRCRYVSVFDLFDEFGVDNCKIEWVEDVVCNSKKELQAREGDHIRNSSCVNKQIAGRSKKEHYVDNREDYLEKFKEYYVENKEDISERMKKYREEHKEELSDKHKIYYEENKEQLNNKQREYYNLNKEIISQKKKEYRKEHKEELSTQRKEYRETNLDKFKEYDKRHYEKNKEQIKEYQKQYRQNNKDIISETKTCECGGIYQKWGHNRHSKSKKHQQFINQNNFQE